MRILFPEDSVRKRAGGENSARNAHPEDFGKRLDHRVGDIVGESPECEARGDQNEWNDIADSVFVQK